MRTSLSVIFLLLFQFASLSVNVLGACDHSMKVLSTEETWLKVDYRKQAEELSWKSKCKVFLGSSIFLTKLSRNANKHSLIYIDPHCSVGLVDEAGDKCTLENGWVFDEHIDWKETWSPTENAHHPLLGKIEQLMTPVGDWAVDLRLVSLSGSKNRIVLQKNPSAPFIPASTTKVLSALSAHLNAGTPWQEMRWWLEESDNDAAQAAWSRGGGAGGVHNALQSIGAPPPMNALHNADGSGLSYANRISAAYSSEVLYALYQSRLFSEVLGAIPRCFPQGPWVQFFCARETNHGYEYLAYPSGANVYAKGGFLNQRRGVRTVAGYGLPGNGVIALFSVFYNGPAGTAVRGEAKIQSLLESFMQYAAQVN